VVAEVGRHRLERERPLLREQVDRVLLHLLKDRPIVGRQVREQLLHRRRPHVGARQQMPAGNAALLDHGDGNLAEPLLKRRLFLE
jgi:hypothetical protein